MGVAKSFFHLSQTGISGPARAGSPNRGAWKCPRYFLLVRLAVDVGLEGAIAEVFFAERAKEIALYLSEVMTSV